MMCRRRGTGRPTCDDRREDDPAARSSQMSFDTSIVEGPLHAASGRPVPPSIAWAFLPRRR
eukprot:5931939-Pyramimonas_sp.AAC.1